MGGKHNEIRQGDIDRGENYFNIRANVSPDGREIDLDIAKGTLARSMPLTFGDACLLYHEIRVSLGVAKGRQRMTKELAKEAIADLCRTALRPEAIGMQIDSETGDVLIVYLFGEHAPFCVRLSPTQVASAQVELNGLRRKKSN